MMAVEEPRSRLSSYNSYLTFKHTIDRIRESPCTRGQVAHSLGIEIGATWHVMRVLVKNKVIERVRYDNEDGHKKSVYALIKDE